MGGTAGQRAQGGAAAARGRKRPAVVEVPPCWYMRAQRYVCGVGGGGRPGCERATKVGKGRGGAPLWAAVPMRPVLESEMTSPAGTTRPFLTLMPAEDEEHAPVEKKTIHRLGETSRAEAPPAVP